MSVPAPHFLLFSESRLKRKDVERKSEPESDEPLGHWRFVLESLDGSESFEAADDEPLPEVCLPARAPKLSAPRGEPGPSLSPSERASLGERLELLAVVRGLEALDQPSRVTLVTHSRYVSRGLRFGLKEWRESGWLWERFGEMTPVKNHDLWQRVDRALEFHQVECRTWQCEREEAPAREPLGEQTERPDFQNAPPRSAPAALRAPAEKGPSFCQRLLGRLRQALQPSPRRKGRNAPPCGAPQLQA